MSIACHLSRLQRKLDPKHLIKGIFYLVIPFNSLGNLIIIRLNKAQLLPCLTKVNKSLCGARFNSAIVIKT